MKISRLGEKNQHNYATDVGLFLISFLDEARKNIHSRSRLVDFGPLRGEEN